MASRLVDALGFQSAPVEPPLDVSGRNAFLKLLGLENVGAYLSNPAPPPIPNMPAMPGKIPGTDDPRPTGAMLELGAFAAGMLPAGGAARGGAALAKALAPKWSTPKLEPAGIRAFHGSPHDFDRFDMSKIGTGEGAQAFGHGLYFAGYEPTAAYYRNYISHMGTDWNDPKAVASYLADKYGGREGAIKNTKIIPQTDQATRDAIDLLKSGIDLPSRKGAMYEVAIKAEPEQFLHWDKKLRDMPPQARERLENSGLVKLNGPDEGLLGSQIYQAAQNRAYEKGLTSSYAEEPVRATQALREAGLPGIKYLDQGSRGAGEGSHNYVVFDDKLIEILRKYGIMGGMVGGAGAIAAGTPGQAQAAPYGQ